MYAINSISTNISNDFMLKIYKYTVAEIFKKTSTVLFVKMLSVSYFWTSLNFE
jgi:hypothetical protein